MEPEKRPLLWKIRAWWRRKFNPDPPSRFDGLAISLMIICSGLTWEDALRKRSKQNVERKEAWLRGESVQ